MAASSPISYTVQTDDGSTKRDAITLTNDRDPRDTFHINLNRKTPHVEVHRGGPGGPVVATARFVIMSGKTELQFYMGRGGNVTMKLGGIGSTAGLFVSKSNHVTLPAGPSGGTEFTWKGTTRTHMGLGSGGTLELLDKKGARWASFTKGSPGKLEIQSGVGMDFVDQVVASAVSIWEKTRRDKKNTGPGGGSGGGIDGGGGGG